VSRGLRDRRHRAGVTRFVEQEARVMTARPWSLLVDRAERSSATQASDTEIARVKSECCFCGTTDS
jgi:hypothetical protein